MYVLLPDEYVTTKLGSVHAAWSMDVRLMSVWSHFVPKLLQTKETDKWFKPKKQTDKSKNPILCSLPSLFVGLF